MEPTPQPQEESGKQEKFPLSALNHYLFCPRRAYLIHAEGIFTDNEHTIRGDIAHEHADLAGYEVVKGVTLLRALPVWSERLGISGKCDIVEVAGSTRFQRVSGGILPPSDNQPPSCGSLKPVEFKVGPRRKFENDDVQLCAQALCLEEMFATHIPGGAIYHADSKRRREVEFTPALRELTERTVADLHALLEADSVPPAHFIEGRCEKCSLFETCLPRLTDAGSSSTRAAAALFQT